MANRKNSTRKQSKLALRKNLREMARRRRLSQKKLGGESREHNHNSSIPTSSLGNYIGCEELDEKPSLPHSEEILIEELPPATATSHDQEETIHLDACKLENDLCRCCHSEGSFKSLYERYLSFDIQDIMNKQSLNLIMYSDMLRECFDIELTAETKHFKHALCAICDTCIQRLRDAVEFKHQVRGCEKRFREQYLRHNGKDFVLNLEIKQEGPDAKDNDDVKSGVYVHEAAIKDGDVNSTTDGRTRADDGRIADDDDIISDHWEQLELKNKVEDIPVTGKKNTKHNDNTIKKANVKKQKNVGSTKKKRPQKNKKGHADQDAMKLVKRLPPLVKLQEGKDYKRIGDLYECGVCDKKVACIRSHVKFVHLKIPKYACTVCSNTFRTLKYLVKHKLEEHNIDKRFKCNACDKTFYLKTSFTLHIAGFHMMDEKYKCDKCDYETYFKKSYRRHEVVHKTVKDHHCEFCQKSFKRRTTLLFHERIHKGDKRKVCKVCGQAFVQKASLNYHMTKHHPNVNF